MFEPISYQDKRATLNEILLQQLASLVMRTADPSTKQHLQVVLEQYGRGQQLLRDGEVTRILGPVEKDEGVEYLDAGMILEWLKANVGRTYFGTEDHTSAPKGSIGTAGFDKKFNDWLASLPAYDKALNKDIHSGFYRDEMTTGKGHLPMLVIRHGDEVTVVLFYQYVSVMTLNLSKVPADYRWENPNHYALRGEMYTYRGNLTRMEFEVQFAAALADQGIGAIYEPKLETATAGFLQTEEPVHVLDSEPAPVVVSEAGLLDTSVADLVTSDGSEVVEVDATPRGETSVVQHVDETGFLPGDPTVTTPAE